MIAETTTRSHEEPPAPVSAAIWSPPYCRLTAGLFLLATGVAFEALAVTTILPVTVREIGGFDLYGWAFSTFMLANLIGITLAGNEADRRGPIRPLVVGITSFVLGLLLAASAPSMPLLIAGRVVQGFGAGFLFALVFFTIARAYTELLRPRMLALASSAFVLPAMIGPALAGLIAEHLGWRWVFFGLTPLLPLAAALAWPEMRRLAPASVMPAQRSQGITAGVLALGMGLALAGFDASSPVIVRLLVCVGLLLALPALHWLLPVGTLWAARGLPAAVAITGLLHLAFYGVDAFVPLALTTIRGQSPVIAGLAVTTGSLCWTLGVWLQARQPAQRRRMIVCGGLCLLAVGVIGLAGAVLLPIPVLFAILAWGIAGLGMGLADSANTLAGLEAAPAGAEGTSTASLQLANVLGIALGTGIGGGIIARTHAETDTFTPGIVTQQLVMVGIIGLAVCIAALRFPGRN